ncbi:MAG: hypothetical protein ACK56I_22620, partial [bacterium]
IRPARARVTSRRLALPVVRKARRVTDRAVRPAFIACGVKVPRTEDAHDADVKVQHTRVRRTRREGGGGVVAVGGRDVVLAGRRADDARDFCAPLDARHIGHRQRVVRTRAHAPEERCAGEAGCLVGRDVRRHRVGAN